MLVLLLVSCKTIPEWDKEMVDNPVEDGRCPDLSGRFNYEHLKWKNIREWDPILANSLPDNLPGEGPVPKNHSPLCVKRGINCIPVPPPAPDDFYQGHYAAPTIYTKIFKGRFETYPGTVIVTLTRLDKSGRKYHVRADWDVEGLLGEYDFKFDNMWICSQNKLIRLAKSTLYELPDPDEVDPKDYRRIYVLPNGNIQIDRKHTFNASWLQKNDLARYYVSLVFAKIPQ